MSAAASLPEPFHFGPPHRLLFGIRHPAASLAAGRSGVVVCNAFGQEAVRAHRTLRVLAERLARAGHDVLRFDYAGTGDSSGDDADCDLDGFANDIREADRALCARSGATTTVWIAMRLGAAAAMRAAAQAPAGLRKLILWDPVLDGARYLSHLRARHVDNLEDAFSVMPSPAPSRLAIDPAQYRDEAIGFALPATFRAQVSELRTAAHRWPTLPRDIAVVTDPGDADGRDLAQVCAREPERVEVVAARHGSDWTGDSAETGTLVAAPALEQLLRLAVAPP